MVESARWVGSRRDWAAVLDQMLEGSEPAALKLGRLITGFLASWRAYDFRDDQVLPLC